MGIAFLNVATYSAVNLLLFSSWYFLIFGKKHSISFADRLTGVFTLGLAQIILTEMLLGILFEKLFVFHLLVLNISISLTVLALAIILHRKETPSTGNKKAGLFKDVFDELKAETAGILGTFKGDSILFLMFGFFLIASVWMVFLGYLFPSYTWDALWYHLPVVGYIMQSGGIQENYSPFLIDLFINIFPKNIELFFVWNTIFLKSDIITDLSQLPFTIAGVLAIYSIAVKLGLKAEHALYSSFLFFFTPVVILQSTTNYVDIAVSVLFLVAINFLMCGNSERAPGGKTESVQQIDMRTPILLAGLSAGILIGSKGSGPLFFVVLSGMFLAGEYIKRFNPFSILPSGYRGYSLKESLIQYFFCFMVPIVLMGGYWYIKNWALYGNPVYPFEISFFNTTLFKGSYKGIIDPLPLILNDLSPLSRLFYVWLEKVEYYLYDSRFSGFGPAWFILLLPSTVTALFGCIQKKRYGFLLVGAALVITFILYPRNWYTRYVVFIIALGSLSFGLTLDYFNRRQNVLRFVALFLVIYTFFTANSPCIMPGKVKEFIGMPPEERTIARLAPFNIDLQTRQDYGMWIWINKNMSEGKILAYTFEQLFLSPLWNSSFSNKILYVKSGNYNEWAKSLGDKNVTHLLIRQNSTEDKWIKKVQKLIYNSPSWLGVSQGISRRFKVVYSDENYKILSLQGGSEGI